MPILKDLRGLFTRRRPVEMDISGTQASALADTGRWSDDDTPSIINEAQAPIERRNGKAKPAAELPQRIDEVMGLVRQIGSHLEAQNKQNDQLLEHLERLPRALDALPEINRQNARLIEIVSEHLDHARRREGALNDTLAGLSETATRQTEVLGLLQQQLDANSHASESLSEHLGGFRDALGDLASTNERTAKMLNHLSVTNERRENELTTMLASTQKWVIAAMIGCAATSATAIIVAAIALFR